MVLMPLFLVVLNLARADDVHVGVIKDVTGHVTLTRRHTTLDVVPGMRVRIADRLRSGPGGAAGIVFKDDTSVTLQASADLTVREYLFQPDTGRYAFSVYLDKGSALYASGKIGKLAPGQVKMETPTATIGARGRPFVFQADDATDFRKPDAARPSPPHVGQAN